MVVPKVVLDPRFSTVAELPQGLARPLVDRYERSVEGGQEYDSFVLQVADFGQTVVLLKQDTVSRNASNTGTVKPYALVCFALTSTFTWSRGSEPTRNNPTNSGTSVRTINAILSLDVVLR